MSSVHAKWLCLALAAVLCVGCTRGAAAGRAKVLGQDRIIAFLYLPKEADPKSLHSATVLACKPSEWKEWGERGVVPVQGKTWFDLLRNPVEKAVEILTTMDYGGNPSPVVTIDEFGFDFGGQTDQKSAKILRMTKAKMPQLHLAVWQMRGPIAPDLAKAYREVVDLVLLEAYVGGKADYWWILTQVAAARMAGLLDKTIVGLGLGVGGRPGETWAKTKAELEQQIRFVRLVAPESPGVGFFAAGVMNGEPGLLAYADELCGRFQQLPTDGSGLPDELLQLHKTFAEPHKEATLVGCPRWAEPDRSWEDPSNLVEPKTMRVLLMNLGEKDATNIKVRLRNPKDKGGDVFAEGTATIPKRSVSVAALPVIAKWQVWKTWDMEVDAPGCEVLIYPRKP